MKPALTIIWHADPEIERTCPRVPHHSWQRFRAGDVFAYAIDPNEHIVFCAACFVLRCGQPEQSYPECNLAITHLPPHRNDHGVRLEPWPEDAKPEEVAVEPKHEGRPGKMRRR